MSRYQFSSTFAGEIDAAAGVIRGVSVITEGPALGHGVMIDAASLASVKECCDTYSGGLRVKINHGTGTDAICGVLRNFRIEGNQLRADLHLLQSHPMRAQLLEMAKEIPEAFGLSISFSGQVEEIDSVEFIRCLEIYSCDVVSEPAANPSGLFSRVDTPEADKMTVETLSAQLEANKATLSAYEGDITNLRAQNGALITERDGFKVQLATAQADLATASAKANKAETDLAAEKVDFAKRIEEAGKLTNAKVSAFLASNGHPPLRLAAAYDATAKEISREAFASWSPAQQAEFCRAGGKVSDSAD